MLPISKAQVKYLTMLVCIIILVSSFLPWAEILFVNFSAFEFGFGTLGGGKIDLFQIQMFLVFAIPLCLTSLTILEITLKRTFSWLIYFIMSVVLIYISLFNSVIELDSSSEIGQVSAIIGSCLLCLVSVTIKRKNE